jgi:hypothetical protein
MKCTLPQEHKLTSAVAAAYTRQSYLYNTTELVWCVQHIYMIAYLQLCKLAEPRRVVIP